MADAKGEVLDADFGLAFKLVADGKILAPDFDLENADGFTISDCLICVTVAVAVADGLCVIAFVSKLAFKLCRPGDVLVEDDDGFGFAVGLTRVGIMLTSDDFLLLLPLLLAAKDFGLYSCRSLE